MESAFGIEHGEFSKNAFTHAMGAGIKGLHPSNIKSTWNGMSTGAKIGTVGGSGVVGLGMGLQQRKKNIATTGRTTGNGGLVGVVARHTKLGYVKRSLTPGQA